MFQFRWANSGSFLANSQDIKRHKKTFAAPLCMKSGWPGCADRCEEISASLSEEEEQVMEVWSGVSRDLLCLKHLEASWSNLFLSVSDIYKSLQRIQLGQNPVDIVDSAAFRAALTEHQYVGWVTTKFDRVWPCLTNLQFLVPHRNRKWWTLCRRVCRQRMATYGRDNLSQWLRNILRCLKMS